MIKLFLLRSICGDHGTHDANTIVSFPTEYAGHLVKMKLARRATKEDAELVKKAMLESPLRSQAVEAASSKSAPKRKQTTQKRSTKKTASRSRAKKSAAAKK